MIIAGTGHRPEYCPCKYKESHPWLNDLKNRLSYYLGIWNHTIGDEDLIIRTGMAIGWDTWLAETALEMDLEIHAFVPFPGQEKAWPTKSREKYQKILDKSKEVCYTADKYHPRVFLDRDDAMITGVDKVVALLNPEAESGGTYYTVKKAESMNLEVINFWKD